ncbi:MAG: formyltransferase family protein [Candidatus Omnitrophota bacterium]
MVKNIRIVLFTKPDKPTVKEAIAYLRNNFSDLSVYAGNRGDPFPKKALKGDQEILVSYISPWIIPENILRRTKLWNINFHPGPPGYPGIGCFNFAIYNGEKTYGATAHIMENKVDTGKIIGVRRFPFSKGDSVYALSIKTYDQMLALFYEVMDFILAHNDLPRTGEKWKRIPYTRRQLNELCRINAGMKKNEIEKRIRATVYPGMPGAYIEIHGQKFTYTENE